MRENFQARTASEQSPMWGIMISGQLISRKRRRLHCRDDLNDMGYSEGLEKLGLCSQETEARRISGFLTEHPPVRWR